MNVLIIDNGSRHSDKIEAFFDGWNVKRLSYDDPAIHDTPEDTLAVLTGGGKMSVIGHREEYENEFEFVRRFGGPVIGICLGSEIIAHVHDVWITRLDSRVEGQRRLSVTADGAEAGLRDGVSVYEAHRWAVKDEDMNGQLTVLARSEDGIEAFKHIERPLYGTQFHPEVGEGTDGHEIFRLLVEQAISSMKTTSMI